MKRICLLTNTLGTGGAERALVGLANYLIINNFKVDIVVSMIGEKIYDVDSQINIINLLDDFKSNNRVQKYIYKMNKFNEYIKNNKVDLIYSLSLTSLFYPILNRKCKNIIKISSIRYNPYAKKSCLHKCMRKFVLNKSDAVIFQTKRAKEYFSKIIKSQKFVVENGVSNNDVYLQEYPEVRTKRIVAVGREAKEKDYDTLVKAFSIVNKSNPEYCLEIYGKGGFDSLKELAVQLGIIDNIRFMGVQKDVIPMINDASCYVLSSNSEGMPNALLEALAIGLPCVATDCQTGPRELIEDGVNGLLVPVGDAELMARAIIKMIEDKNFAHNCSMNALQIKETHSMEQIGAKYISIFNGIMNK